MPFHRPKSQTGKPNLYRTGSFRPPALNERDFVIVPRVTNTKVVWYGTAQDKLTAEAGRDHERFVTGRRQVSVHSVPAPRAAFVERGMRFKLLPPSQGTPTDYCPPHLRVLRRGKPLLFYWVRASRKREVTLPLGRLMSADKQACQPEQTVTHLSGLDIKRLVSAEGFEPSTP